MPKPDHQIITRVLAAVLAEGDAHRSSETQLFAPRPGTLRAETQPMITSAVNAWAAFAQLDGPGWLQNAHTPEVLHGDAAALTAQLEGVAADKRWPVIGERVSGNGQTSLRLRRTTHGWAITRLAHAEADLGIILTRRLLSRDLRRYLICHVAYEPQKVGDHEELRPVASRFVGFETARSGGVTPSAPAPTT